MLLDIEIAFTFDLGIVRVDPAHPVTTRYKAIGVRSSWDTAPGPGGQVDYLPVPVFDPSRGYTLDIPAGALIGQPAARRAAARSSASGSAATTRPTSRSRSASASTSASSTSRRVRVRARLDGPPFDLQLTKLVASLEVPGVLHGTRLASSSRRSGSRARSTSRSCPSTSAPPRSLAVESQRRRHRRAHRHRGRVPGADPARQLRARHLRLPRRRRRQLRAQRGAPASGQVPALDWLQAQLAAARRRHGPGRLDDDAGLATRSPPACCSAPSTAASSSTSRASC